MIPNFILRRTWLFNLLTIITLGGLEALQEGWEQGTLWGNCSKDLKPRAPYWMGWAYRLGFNAGVTYGLERREEYEQWVAREKIGY